MRKLAVCVAVCLASTAPAIAQNRVVPEQLTLAEALRIAGERNPLYAAARNAIEAAEAQRIDASRRLNPAFTLDSVGRPLGQTPPALDDHEFLFRIDQEIETGGRRRLRTQVADAAIEVAKSDAANRLRQLELEVRRAYFQAVLAKADREVAEVSLQEIDAVVALNEARLSSGEISGAELRRVQVERLRFVDDVFASELAFRNSKSALLALLNAPNLGEEFDPVERLQGATGEGASLVAAIVPSVLMDRNLALQQASASRPDVLAARNDETRAETETRLQRALRTPNVTVGGGYSHLGGLNTFAFGATVPIPIFNRNQGSVLRAEAERRAAANRTAAAVAQASLEVQQAQNAVGINSARVAYIEREYLKNATEARDIVLASYRLGSANLIDFLDAQRSFRDTVRTYNRALFEQRVSIFQLQAAVGAPAPSR